MTMINETTGKKKFHRLQLSGADYTPLLACAMGTTREFALMVGESLRKLFSDIHGANIVMDPSYLSGNDPLRLTLFFKYSPETADDNTIQAVRRIDEKDEGVSDTLSAINKFNKQFGSNNSAPKLFELTEEAKEILEQLAPADCFNNRKPNWGMITDNVITSEYSESTYFGNSTVVYLAVRVDFSKVLAAFYGYTDEQGYKYNYRVNVIGPVSPNVAPGQAAPVVNDWRILIARLNATELENVSRKTGLVMNSNKLDIVRPSGI